MSRAADGQEETSLEALLADVAERRDRAAFAKLFAIYAPRVKGQLIARGAKGGIAEELAQEVMLTIWRKADLFDPSRGAASTWIFAITRNCHLNQLRAQAYPQIEDDDPALVPSPAVPDPEGQLATAQDSWAVDRALAQLPHEQREVVHGAYFRGRTLREVADEQQVALGTVKTRVRLALERLRNILKDQGKNLEKDKEGKSHERKSG